MAVCVHCHGRKGKRACPALRGQICAACCGEYRLVEIACPPECIYLKSHEDYQRKRTLDRVPRPWLGRILRYDRQGGPSQIIVHEVQLAACAFAAEKGRLDRDALREGLEFARRRMSPIETPEPYVPPFGEFLVKRLDQVIGERAPVEREGVREVLDETLRHVEGDVPPESFAEFLKFLRALYADHLSGSGARAGSSLIVPR